MSEGETSGRTWQLALGLAVIVLFGFGLMLMQGGVSDPDGAPVAEPVDSPEAGTSGTGSMGGSTGSGTTGGATKGTAGGGADAAEQDSTEAPEQSGAVTPVQGGAVDTAPDTRAAGTDDATGADGARSAAQADRTDPTGPVASVAGPVATVAQDSAAATSGGLTGPVAALASPDDASAQTENTEPAPVGPTASDLPRFDLVRIDPEGGATIAGQAAAGGTVLILSEGEELARSTVGRDGSFAALFDIPPGDAPRVLMLEVMLADGARQQSEQTVIITPPAMVEQAAPQIAALAAPGVTGGANADATGAAGLTAPAGAGTGGGAVAGGVPQGAAEPAPETPAAPDAPNVSRALAEQDGAAPDLGPVQTRTQMAEMAPQVAPRAEDAAAGTDGADVAAVDVPDASSDGTESQAVDETTAGGDGATTTIPAVETAVAAVPEVEVAASDVTPVELAAVDGAVAETGAGALTGGASGRAGAVAVASAPQVGASVSRAAAQPALPAPTPRAPSVLLQDRDGVRLLQPASPPAGTADAPAAPVDLAVDAISYGAAGEVRLDGRGKAGSGDTVLIYLDNALRGDAKLSGDGRWSLELTDVVPGLYTLRADQIGAAGAVTARFETPFQREAPEALAEVMPAAAELDPAGGTGGAGAVAAGTRGAATLTAEPGAGADDAIAAQNSDPARVAVTAITVQPGYTLWGIASDRYGDGFSYVKIFEANGGQIRNPDLIYPGQVFDLPD
ncbi:LysM peptidoglycan-binding domain-containing protein [Pacificitalea manganoxidans]|nr:LysM peptidoglycan-binding domain-containing protein [Pacificitalea manganoxidans]MDR6307749.1 hypothetical protein [Pacificitalea manganoxidans]